MQHKIARPASFVRRLERGVGMHLIPVLLALAAISGVWGIATDAIADVTLIVCISCW